MQVRKETLYRIGDWRRSLSPRVLTPSLDPAGGSKVIDPCGWEIAAAMVVDGLDTFCEREANDALRKIGFSPVMNRRSSVSGVEMGLGNRCRVRECAPLSLEIPVLQEAILQDATLIESPIPDFDTRVRSAKIPMIKGSEPPPSCTSLTCSIPVTDVHDATCRMRTFPHIRRAVSPKFIADELRAGFLRDAEASSGINTSDGEVLAVFRNIPLSLISRFRLLAESGVLLYTVSDFENGSRVRVHDVAAVRDKVRDSTHLVAHRTRYRTVNLA